MGSQKPPAKTQQLMYFLMKEARRQSLMEWLEEIGISEDEFSKIEVWFSQYEIKI
ncbi:MULTISPECIES: hypothetical protein [unclassified Providencia]|uniref:hypothetical protein n=1 Tax=unclassified Providencia TaxID=2633465 RepID=UPI00144829B6|nr:MULTISPECIES: hypothetical protein [unclassified Providencia]